MLQHIPNFTRGKWPHGSKGNNSHKQNAVQDFSGLFSKAHIETDKGILKIKECNYASQS